MLYAFASAANTNGSAFAGLNANTDFANTTLAVVMPVGRYVPLVLTLALAGAFAQQRRRPVTAASLPTSGPLFVALITVVALGAGSVLRLAFMIDEDRGRLRRAPAAKILADHESAGHERTGRG